MICKVFFPKFHATPHLSLHSNGIKDQYKARLVAKDIDYHESFAPVAKINIMRILLSVMVNNSWTLSNGYKNIFL
jgi:hypothetical protein